MFFRNLPLVVVVSCLALSVPGSGFGAERKGRKASAERGEAALLERSYAHGMISRQGYDTLWMQWGLSEKPADFDEQVLRRYGLHPSAYRNDGYPMGIRPETPEKGSDLTIDCMVCHAGSLMGKSYIGLPNTSLDLAGLFQAFAISRGVPFMAPYRLSHVRGTTEATATAIFLSSFRDAELNVRMPAAFHPIPDQMCEDPPAWWLLKHKKTMYHNGRLDARAVRPLMSFMMSPMTSGARFRKLEPAFSDIRAYLLTIQAPKYPFAIDADLARAGREIFEDSCAKCHGMDGEYPNKVIPLEKIGTDGEMLRSLSARVEADYREGWFGREPGPDGKPYPIRESGGYQAPPLEGVWATAPYFHNGSVPTLEAVLNSKARPRIYTRSFRTGEEDYDKVRVGWKTTEVASADDGYAELVAERRVYDTTQTGRGNGGHEFGDELTGEERKAVVEYLKTL